MQTDFVRDVTRVEFALNFGSSVALKRFLECNKFGELSVLCLRVGLSALQLVMSF